MICDMICYHSLDMNGGISMVNSQKGYFSFIQDFLKVLSDMKSCIIHGVITFILFAYPFPMLPIVQPAVCIRAVWYGASLWPGCVNMTRNIALATMAAGVTWQLALTRALTYHQKCLLVNVFVLLWTKLFEFNYACLLNDKFVIFRMFLCNAKNINGLVIMTYGLWPHVIPYQPKPLIFYCIAWTRGG